MMYSSLRQPLSSILTFVFKFIQPAVWIGGLGTAAIKSLFSEPKQAGVYIAALLLIIAILYRPYLQLKFVEIDERNLYVSNYIKTIQIPFHEIEDVTESFFKPRPIQITFKKVTEFGKEIVFIPYFDFQGWLLMSHPAVAKLRKLAGLMTH